MSQAKLFSAVLVLIIACSVRSERIIGGSLARPGQIPYIVTLLRVIETDNGTVGSLSCAGSIISDQWIVSAAHCTQGPSLNTSLQILVGALNITNDGDIYAVQRVVNHPEYNSTAFENDISLIQLNTTLEWSDSVKLIPLSSRFIDGGVRTLTSGWGITEHGDISNDLRYVHLYSLEWDKCRQQASAQNVTDVIHNSTICALLGSGSGTCRGDSGGPLVARHQLIGIVSWGIRPCGAGNPDGFTRVSSFLDWVFEVTGVSAV